MNDEDLEELTERLADLGRSLEAASRDMYNDNPDAAHNLQQAAYEVYEIGKIVQEEHL